MLQPSLLLYWIVVALSLTMTMRFIAVQSCIDFARYQNMQLFGTRSVTDMKSAGTADTYRLFAVRVIGSDKTFELSKNIAENAQDSLWSAVFPESPLLVITAGVFVLTSCYLSVFVLKHFERLYAVATHQALCGRRSVIRGTRQTVCLALAGVAVGALTATIAFRASLAIISPVLMVDLTDSAAIVFVPVILAAFGFGTLCLILIVHFLHRPDKSDTRLLCPVCAYEVVGTGCPECGWGITSTWSRSRLAGTIVPIVGTIIISTILPSLAWVGLLASKQRAIANPVFLTNRELGVFVATGNREVLLDVARDEQLLIAVVVQSKDVPRDSMLVWQRQRDATNWNYLGDLCTLQPGISLPVLGVSTKVSLSLAPFQTGFRLAACIDPPPTRLEPASDELVRSLRANLSQGAMGSEHNIE